MTTFANELQILLTNNKEHLEFLTIEMAKMLNTTKEDIVENHLDKLITMFISTV
jgi:hypothetical protein